ncbi:MAG: hypothetical protein ACFFAO_12025, partial [Candidatus Hermodarchaeota archaeon]
KSSRHIFKIPFEIPIKQYNFKNPNHQKLVIIGRKCEILVKNTIDHNFKTRNESISKVKLQKKLAELLNPFLIKIDKILKSEFY